MTGPLLPDEAIERKRESVPEVMFEIFNELIVENLRGERATFRQREVINKMRSRDINVDEAFDKGWCDVEPMYRAAGWEVVYDAPGFNETYPTTWTFKKPRKSA